MQPIPLRESVAKRLKAGGVWVPSPLALDERHRMIEARQRLLTLYYVRSGARTVIPGAHTGEFAGGSLHLFDRWLGLVAEAVRRWGGEDMFLMAAVGGPQARAQAEAAARHGYDLVMVAPTAFAGLSDEGVVCAFRDIATVIPAFGFELPRAVPGSREYPPAVWDAIFEVACGAKGASFDTYRSQRMLESAALCPRRQDLVLATGNDDRIVSDLGGVFPFRVAGQQVVMRYSAGLLGHFATDTHAAVHWARAVMAARDGAAWELPIERVALAHLVNMCNGALFDALCNFENSVWGVKMRLTQLGLLEAPYCFHESGRSGQAEAIRDAYAAHPLLNDEAFVAEHLDEWKREALP
jgi:hypothetical protein